MGLESLEGFLVMTSTEDPIMANLIERAPSESCVQGQVTIDFQSDYTYDSVAFTRVIA